MALKQQIQTDMKTAMKSGDKFRLKTIRMLLAGIKQREVDERIVLTDEQVIVVLEKMIKQRQESVKQYQQAQRQDLADQEAQEIEILQTYLPEPLTDAEISEIIQQAFAETNASSMKDMAKVMGLIKPQVQGRADLGKISATVKQQLQSTTPKPIGT